MRKTAQVLSCLALIFSSHLMAAQYEFPVDAIAETKPSEAEKIGAAGLAKMKQLSRFSMPVFEAGPEIGGKVRYQLPEVLTGKTVEITMDKITEEDGVRRYQTQNGTAEGTCTGPRDKPNCSIKLANLQLQSASNIALRNKAIDLAYRDPSSRLAVRRIGDLFMEQMPIGIIRGADPAQLPSLVGRWWSGRYFVDKKPVSHLLCFYQRSEGIEGHFRVGASSTGSSACGVCPQDEVSFCGKIKNISLNGDILAGSWEANASSSGAGWVEFQFTPQLDFVGSYGLGDEARRAGSWSGTVR